MTCLASPFAHRWFVVVVFLASVSCSNYVSGPETSGPCTTDVSVTVSAGTTPTFTWTPACRVIGLLVEEGASDRWLLEATGAGIAPGVTYGSVPAGASEDAPAIPLVSGTTYEVILSRGTPANATRAAIEEFTP
ncbi:MAG: hypothetical protein WD802_06030 [Gemmatimonadaceae bacterium]